MARFFHNIGLKTKLLIMMLSLCMLSVGLLFLFYQIAEESLIVSVKRYAEELSSAIQISVEQLTVEDMNRNEEILKEYVGQFKKRGVKEISILNNEMEVVASSNPKKIGKTVDMKGKKIGRPEVTQESFSTEGKRSYDLVLPVVVGYEQLGYIHIIMRFDDFADLLRSNHYKRLFGTSIVFAIGIAFSIFLSGKYVKPIDNLAKATRRIAAGDLHDIGEVDGRDEISDLIRNFNNMVKSLKENKKLEERLHAVEHLSKIGQLASGIAHEIRNPLNFINLSIDHLKSEYEPQDPQKREAFHGVVSHVKSEISRLNSMISNFLNYGKPISLKREKIFMHDIIREVIMIANHMLREQQIELTTNIQDGIPALYLDRQQIKACFMNILLNAIQAMPSGGKLSIEGTVNAGFVTIQIMDTGEGIPEDQLIKIFEPYFSTKEAGIGLGLSITKRIIEAHKGRIDVMSTYGSGTIVSIVLPLQGDELKKENIYADAEREYSHP